MLQEEALWLCEAAHLPVISATEVLRTGQPSRAEVTDAATAQQAGRVMLSKGAHTSTRPSAALDDILRRMSRHQRKNNPRLGPPRSWHEAPVQVT